MKKKPAPVQHRPVTRFECNPFQFSMPSGGSLGNLKILNFEQFVGLSLNQLFRLVEVGLVSQIQQKMHPTLNLV